MITVTSSLPLFAISACMFFRRKLNTKHFSILLVLLLLYAFYVIVDYINSNAGFSKWYLSAISHFCALLFMPSAYLYLRVLVYSDKIEWKDLGHILPAAVYLVNLIAVLFLSDGYLASDKFHWLDVVNLAHLSFCCLVVALYLFLQINIAAAQMRMYYPSSVYKKLSVFKWVFLGGIMQGYFFTFLFYDRYTPYMVKWYWLQLPLIVSAIILGFIFVLKFIKSSGEAHHPVPAFPTYAPLSMSIPEQEQEQEREQEQEQEQDMSMVSEPHAMAGDHTEEPRLQHTHGIVLHEQQLVKIEEKITAIMVEQQHFLKHGYTIRMLSDDVGISLHVLSAYINRKYGVNFNDFINEYRIKFCIEKIKNEEWKHKTLEALSKESGFNNRNSFTLSFKKVIGVTPSHYLKQLSA